MSTPFDVPAMGFWKRLRLPLVLQGESAECALACLAMIAGYWGQRSDLAGLRARFSISLKGVNLKLLLAMADALALQGRAVSLTLAQTAQLRLPCILHWDMNHFVVLASRGARSVTIHDPALGRRTLPLAEFSRHFTGVALELWPGAGFESVHEVARFSLRSLMGHVVGLKRALLRLLLLGLALHLCVLLAPFYLQWVVDEAIITGDHGLLTVLGLGAMLLMLLQSSITAVRSWLATTLATHLNFQWMGNVLAHLLKLPLRWFETRHLGDVVSRFGAVQTLQRTLSTQCVEALIDGLLVCGTLLVMLRYSFTLTMVAALAVALYAMLRLLLLRQLRSATAEQIMHAARQQTQFIETIRGVQSVRLFQRAAERRSGWLNLLAGQLNAELHIARLTITQQCANTLLFGVERVIIIWLAALSVIDARFSVGMLFAFVSYHDQFSQRLTSLIDRLCELRMLRLHGERLADIVLAATEPESMPPGGEVAPLSTDIEMRGVWFRYADGEPYVLRDLNLCIKAGQCLAISGVSGCGKTTLVKLLLGLHQPTAGEILIGGITCRQLGLARLRQLMGSVMQDDQLFSGSVADNISFFDPATDQQQVIDCARSAALHAEIVATPMGYHTLIGDAGTGLSGGQKQRLLLARALYKRPRVLILDEATSHLDLASEQLVNAAIRQLALTRIVVAHRPETIAMAQRVVVLQNGRVVRDLERRSDPVNEHEQPEPHHVDEVPVPGHGLEAEMPGGREVAAHAS
jgi:ATP-binding cassette subfamily B protein RaxB